MIWAILWWERCPDDQGLIKRGKWEKYQKWTSLTVDSPLFSSVVIVQVRSYRSFASVRKKKLTARNLLKHAFTLFVLPVFLVPGSSCLGTLNYISVFSWLTSTPSAVTTTYQEIRKTYCFKDQHCCDWCFKCPEPWPIQGRHSQGGRKSGDSDGRIGRNRCVWTVLGVKECKFSSEEWAHFRKFS